MTKPSTKAIKQTKKRSRCDDIKVSPWLEDYLDCFSFTYKPVNEAFINRISTELVNWAKTDQKAYKIRPFFSNKGIAQDTYCKWVRKYPTFKAAYDLAMAVIGDRREHGAIERKLDSNIVTFMAPHYDADWKSMREYNANLKKEIGGATTAPINVYLDKFPSSDIVPEKKDDKPKTTETPEQVARKLSVRKGDY